jgi:hypothetical protein
LYHLIHYKHDLDLRDIVVLKPDWLATAISYVLDNKETRDAHGLVTSEELSNLWDTPTRPRELRYSPELHVVFRRLMEKFDIAYQVSYTPDHSPGMILVAQLVPDLRPVPIEGWDAYEPTGSLQQVQICRIVDDETGESASAEGIFYQLIVRLHRYSLGRDDYRSSVHWQRGIVLDHDYNGRALLEHIGNDVRITVKAAYPERFLSILTSEVEWLVKTFWRGLRPEVVVPCLAPCGKQRPGYGSFEVQKLVAFRQQGMLTFPCIVSGCNQLQDIDMLLRNASSMRPPAVEQLLAIGLERLLEKLDHIRNQLNQNESAAAERFRALDANDRRLMSQVEDAVSGLLQAYADEAKEGPRLFSLYPISPKFFDRPKWLSAKFRLTLWCEHSRLPLPSLNGEGDRRGVYDLQIPKEWFLRAAPLLRFIGTTLSLALPVASSATKLLLDDASYKGIEEKLDLGQKSLETVIKGGGSIGNWLGRADVNDISSESPSQARGAVLRELYVFLKKKDPGFGGLVRVRNKREEFLWVHSDFAPLYS